MRLRQLLKHGELKFSGQVRGSSRRVLFVFRGQVAELLLEEFGELLGRHANLVSNLRNAVPALLQQRLAPLQANGAHELQRTLASDLHQLLVQATAAEAQAVAEVLNGEVRIVHLLLHDLYGFPDEFLVDGADRDFGRRYVHHLELAVILLRPSQLLLDAQQEYFEVERLGDVIVRPFLQSVEHMCVSTSSTVTVTLPPSWLYLRALVSRL